MKKFVIQRVKKGDILHQMVSDFWRIDLYLKKWRLLLQKIGGSKLRIKLPRNDNTILRENRSEGEESGKKFIQNSDGILQFIQS